MKKNRCKVNVIVVMEVYVTQLRVVENFVNVVMDLPDHFVKYLFVSLTSPFKKNGNYCSLAARQLTCGQASCQNGGTCQEQGLNGICICKPGFTGQRCESGMIDIYIDEYNNKKTLFYLEYFRCQGNGRFADASNCKQGRYFECVYFGQCKL
jgi:hypothetical protein